MSRMGLKASNSIDSRGQIKTRQRVRDLAEVFTHEREVNAMLDLVPDMFPTDSIKLVDAKFLEPACGSGNFLEEILHRKLAGIRFGKVKPVPRYEHWLLRALASIYGVDISEDNVIESRSRLVEVLRSHYNNDANTTVPTEGFASAARAIVSTNNRALQLVAEYGIRLGATGDVRPADAVGQLINYLPIFAFEGGQMHELDAQAVMDWATAGIGASALAARWNSPLLVDVNEHTLDAMLGHPDLLKSLEQIEDFRALAQNAQQIVTSTKNLKKAKREQGGELDPDQKREQSETAKKRKEIREKLQKFLARIPVFMYVTDFREEALKDVIESLDSVLFERVWRTRRKGHPRPQAAEEKPEDPRPHGQYGARGQPVPRDPDGRKTAPRPSAWQDTGESDPLRGGPQGTPDHRRTGRHHAGTPAGTRQQHPAT